MLGEVVQHPSGDLRCRGQPHAEKMPTLVLKRRIQLWLTGQEVPLGAAILSSICLHLHAVAWYAPTRIIRKISDGLCSAHGYGSSHARSGTRLGHPRVRRTVFVSESGGGDSWWRALISYYACTLAHAQQEFLHLLLRFALPITLSTAGFYWFADGTHTAATYTANIVWLRKLRSGHYCRPSDIILHSALGFSVHSFTSPGRVTLHAICLPWSSSHLFPLLAA